MSEKQDDPFVIQMRYVLTREREDGQRAAQYAIRHGVGHICQRLTATERAKAARKKHWQDKDSRTVEAKVQSIDDLHAEALFRNRMTRYARLFAEAIDAERKRDHEAGK